jgi:hypothetical protein
MPRSLQAGVFLVILMLDATLARADLFTFSTIDVPGAAQSWASGINNSGRVTGHYFTSLPGNAQGFLLPNVGSNPVSTNIPGSTESASIGINNSCQIVGFYVTNGGYLGYVLSGFGGPVMTITTINLIGAGNTSIQGINDSGQMVGYYLTNGTINYPQGFYVSSAGGTPTTVVCLAHKARGLGRSTTQVR